MKKKLYILPAFITAALVLISNKFYADDPVSKIITFEITQDYEACSFIISTEVQGNFEVKLGMENSRENYTNVIEDSNFCEISIEDVKAGKWNVTVTEMDQAEEQTLDERENAAEGSVEEEKEIPRTEDEVIGKIQVQAKAIDRTAFSIGNVDVARDIVGLRKYFKDDSIVVEWTDTSCGNVNISLIDTYTNQILDKQTVTGRYYEYKLPELVSEITVDIVPATSSSITGANSRYTLAVVNEPNAVVIYEDREYTNEDEVSVSVQLGDAYSLLFMVNGEEVKTTGMLTEGEYTFKVPVTEGNNEIMTYVIDSEHNMRSTCCTVIRDSIKPALTLDMEYDGIETYDDTITITGNIKDYDTFMINETEPVVAGDGSFKAEYVLRDGENVLNIRATDIAGNETLYSAKVVKLIRETPVILDYIYIPIVAVFLLIVWWAYRCLYKKRKSESKGKSTVKKADNMKKGEREEKSKFLEILLHFIKTEKLRTIVKCMMIVICTYLFFSYILIGGSIPSTSMEPALQVGDYVICNGLAYVIHEPQRGDIVVFAHDGVAGGEMLIKRIIGIPGDSLGFADGYLYINGKPVFESYLQNDMETNSYRSFEEIPEGCYFVMGDNREYSADSRYWDDPYVKKNEIRGKLLSAIPLSRLINTIKNF